MSVWTIVVERHRNHETNFSKPWEPANGFEAHVMYGGSPDSDTAWKSAKRFMSKTLNQAEPEYRLVGMMKGDFSANFYSYLEEETKNE